MNRYFYREDYKKAKKSEKVQDLKKWQRWDTHPTDEIPYSKKDAPCNEKALTLQQKGPCWTNIKKKTCVIHMQSHAEDQ